MIIKNHKKKLKYWPNLPISLKNHKKKILRKSRTELPTLRRRKSWGENCQKQEFFEWAQLWFLIEVRAETKAKMENLKFNQKIVIIIIISTTKK